MSYLDNFKQSNPGIEKYTDDEILSILPDVDPSLRDMSPEEVRAFATASAPSGFGSIVKSSYYSAKGSRDTETGVSQVNDLNDPEFSDLEKGYNENSSFLGISGDKLRRKTKAATGKTDELYDEAQGYLDSGAESLQKASSITLSPSTQKFLNDESESSWLSDFLDDPVTIVTEIGAQSAYGSLESLMSGVAGAAVAGPAGLAVGAGAGSARVEFASSFVESLKEAGVDLSDARNLQVALQENPDLYRSATEEALVRSGIIGLADAATMGLATKSLGLGSGLTKQVSNAAAQGVVQTGGGAAGEAGAQLAVDGEISSPRQVAAEAVGELVTAPVDIAAGSYTAARELKQGAQPQPDETPADPVQSNIDDINQFKDSLTAQEMGLSMPEPVDYSQYDQPSVNRVGEQLDGLSEIEQAIRIAEKEGFADEAVRLNTAKSYFDKAELARQQGMESVAGEFSEKGNAIYRDVMEQPLPEQQARPDQFPQPYVSEGEIQGGELTIIDQPRAEMEPTPDIEGQSQEIPQEQLPPGTNQINQGYERPERQFSPVDPLYEGVGRNVVERQAGDKQALPPANPARSITPDQLQSLQKIRGVALRTKIRERTPEQVEAIQIVEAVKAGEVEVSNDRSDNAGNGVYRGNEGAPSNNAEGSNGDSKTDLSSQAASTQLPELPGTPEASSNADLSMGAGREVDDSALDVSLNAKGLPYVSEKSAKTSKAYRSNKETAKVVPVEGGFGIATPKAEQRKTSKPSDSDLSVVSESLSYAESKAQVNDLRTSNQNDQFFVRPNKATKGKFDIYTDGKATKPEAAVITEPVVKQTPAKPAEASENADITETANKGESAVFKPDSGTLNIPRSEMPQIKAEHRGAMVNFMNARGIKHDQVDVDPLTLKPTQADFMPEKVKAAKEHEGGDRSILISSDNHVLDGHHQWLAKREGGQPIKAIKLDAPIADLVPLANEFPSSENEQSSEGGQSNNSQTTVKQTKADSPKEQNKAKAQAAPIKDFGEKIGGARKDTWTGFRDSLNEDFDTKTLPLSKSFPAPDYKALIDSGVDREAIAIIAMLRDRIASKPRVKYKVERWAEGVDAARGIARELLDGTSSVSDVKAQLRKGGSALLSIADSAEVIATADASVMAEAAGFRIESGHFSVFNGKKYDPPADLYFITKGNSTDYSRASKTLSEVQQSLKAVIANLKPNTSTKRYSKVSVYIDRYTKKAFLGWKGASGVLRIKSFNDTREARNYLKENPDAIESELTKLKQTPGMRRPENGKRIGPARYAGNVDPEIFADTFGFKGVEFGNWVENDKRQKDLNEAYDGLMDLSELLDIPPKAVSLNGELSLAFGARGKGMTQGGITPAAHYEPGYVVINLTKKKGSGSLAHEWWHAADNYFSRMRGEKMGYISESPYPKMDKSVRKEVLDAYKGVLLAIRKSDLAIRAAELDKRKSKVYWATPVELTARAFESFTISKLKDKGITNDYLANIVSEEYWNAAEALGLEGIETYPYPKEAELESINEAYQHLFDTIQTKETDQGVAMFSRAQPKEPTIPLTKSANQSDANYLSNHLSRYFNDDRWKESFTGYALPDSLGEFGKAVQAAFGKRIAAVMPTSREFDILDGIHIQGRETIFVNPSERVSFVGITGHELYHEIAKSRPDLHKWLTGKLADHVDEGNFEAYRERLDSLLQPGEPLHSNDVVQEELLADLMGDAFLDKPFLEALAKDNPTYFRRLVNAINIYLNKIKGRLKGLNSKRYFNDVSAMQKHLRSVLNAYADGVEISEVATPKTSNENVVELAKYREEKAAFFEWLREQKAGNFSRVDAVSSEKNQVADSMENNELADSDLWDRAKVAEGKGYDRVFAHASPSKEFVIPSKRSGFEIFDGIFLNEGMESRYSHGEYQHRYVVSSDKVAGERDSDLDYDQSISFIKSKFPDMTDDQIDSVYNFTAGDENVYDSEDNPLEDYGYPEIHEASWEYQNIRGLIAKDQGFDAIAMNDEFGISYFIPEGSGAKNLLDPEFDLPSSDNARKQDSSSFSRQSQEAEQEPQSVAETFAIPTDSLVASGIRKIADKFKVLKDLQANIKATGAEIDETADAYMAEELFHGKAENDLRQMRQTFVEPLAKKMADFGITQAELDEYLYAKHAAERNKRIAKINPDLQDGGSGKTNAEASEIISNVELSGKANQYEQVAAIVYDMLAAKRDQIRAAGLEGSDVVDAWEASYQYYVPLKGFAADETQDGLPRSGKGFTIGGKESKRATGRTSEAASPSSYAISDLTETLIRKRKNEVGNAFLNLVEANPNSDYWQVFTDENPETDRRIVKSKDPLTGETIETVKEMPLPMAMLQDRYFTTKRDGVTHYIKLEDPRLMKAMKNIGPDTSNFVIQGMAKINRFLSAVNTSYNPEFVVGNFARDIQTAALNLSAEQTRDDGKAKGEQIVKQTIKDVPKAMKAVYRSMRGKPAKNTEWANYFEEFQADGAKTGYFDMKDIDGQAKDVQRLIDISKGGFKGGFYKWTQAAGKLVEDTNNSVENAVRLSAYVNARKAGISRAKAASLAKNMTVNFNRRGEMGTTLNALYMFANASIQGSMNFARTMIGLNGEKGDPIWSRLNKAQKISIGIMAGSYAFAMANRMGAGEDDDGENWYDKVPQYVKERNLVIMKSLTGGEQDGKYWKIPLPYGYNIFHVMGTSMESVANDPSKTGQAATDLAFAALGSFSPIGFQDSNSATGIILKNVTPTLGKPIVDLAMNENFMGSSIYNENFPFGTPKPESSLSRRSTPEAYKAIAEFLNDQTGGSQWRSGSIDINPDKIRYIVDYALGGSGKFFISKSPDNAQYAYNLMLPDAHRTVFLSRVSGKVLPYEDQNKFYDRRDEINQIKEEYKALTGGEKLKFYRDNREKMALQGMVKGIEKQLKALRKQRDAVYALDLPLATRERRLDIVEGKMKRVVDRFNKAYSAAN